MRKQRDRRIDDLTPSLAIYMLRHARKHVDDLATDQHERTGPKGARYQAQGILYTAIANVCRAEAKQLNYGKEMRKAND